uniref:Uncharacterized protein n=1 Tax=Anguilla anguilla TaxID=7936 RepID=A0A0E9RH19_ANGAN
MWECNALRSQSDLRDH